MLTRSIATSRRTDRGHAMVEVEPRFEICLMITNSRRWMHRTEGKAAMKQIRYTALIRPCGIAILPA